MEQVDHDLLKVIDKNTLNNLYDEKVLIFKDSTLIYSSIDDMKIQYGPSFLIRQKKKKSSSRPGDMTNLPLYVSSRIQISISFSLPHTTNTAGE